QSQSKSKVVRFDASIPVVIAQDSYFVVEAGAKLNPLPTADTFAATIVPGLIPIGFTNPIFVDLAGDGFDPPGLPVMASAAGVGEQIPVFAALQRADESVWARAYGWVRHTLASTRSWGRVVAEDEQQQVLTGRELAEDMKRRRGVPTNEYFPLYHFR